jgi:hypothetical protein
MARDGITYSPDKEQELIKIMGEYMEKAGMSPKAIRYYLSYDEDFVSDQLEHLPRKGVSEDFFGIDDSIKGKIQNIVSKLSDVPGMWDHRAQTFTDRGMDKLKTVLKNNPKYIKYAVNLTADDFDESIEEGRGTREFEVDGYTYMTDIDEEEDNRKIWHMLKTPEGKTIDVDFTPYAYMTKDDVELYIKLDMPERRGVGPLDTEQLQKMAQIKGVAMLDPKMARAGM